MVICRSESSALENNVPSKPATFSVVRLTVVGPNPSIELIANPDFSGSASSISRLSPVLRLIVMDLIIA